MPNVSKGRMLTFSKKNQDVRDIIEDELKTGIKFPDYICNAVRFYEKYKDYDFNNTNKNTDLSNIDNLVENKIIEILKNKNILNLVEKQELSIEEQNKKLEEDLDYVDIDED
ncbi:hypothetical protein [Paraclostridium bifermentans]|uniref:hypothetical protein n=1 Tax=Paraclostridium bifermentans TaxID=1490 RepID=UPI00387B32D1